MGEIVTFTFISARPSVFISVAAAALLALTSCSGAGTPVASRQEQPAASAEQSAGAAPAPEKTEEQQAEKPAGSSKEFTEAQLTAILEGLKDADGKPLTLIPAAQLKQGQEVTKTTLAGVTITPEACKAYANSNAQLPDGSVYAAGSWMGDVTAGEMTVVTVLSAKPQVLSATMDRAGKNSGACSTFTMEIAGQSIKTTMKPVGVDTSAEVEKGMLISQDMPTGTTNTVTLEALQGGLLVSVVQVGGDGSEAAAKKLATVVDQVIAAS